jgi:hypothetical protein
MAGPAQVVSSKEWIEARKKFPLEEKEFPRLRDQDEQNRGLAAAVLLRLKRAALRHVDPNDGRVRQPCNTAVGDRAQVLRCR